MILIVLRLVILKYLNIPKINIHIFQYFAGKHLVVINKTSIPQDKQADLVIEGKIGEVFAQLRQED